MIMKFLIHTCLNIIMQIYLSLDFYAFQSIFLAPAVTVGETEGAMDSTSVFFLPLLLPITL